MNFIKDGFWFNKKSTSWYTFFKSRQEKKFLTAGFRVLGSLVVRSSRKFEARKIFFMSTFQRFMETLFALRINKLSKFSREMLSIVSSKVILGIFLSFTCCGKVPRT